MADIAYLNVKTNFKEVDAAGKSLDNFSNSATRAGRGAAKAANEIKQTENSMRGLGIAANFAAGLFAGLVSFQAIKGVVQIADQMNVLQARIKNSVKAGEDFKGTFSALGKISAETGTQLGTTIDIFQRLSFTRTEIGANIDEMLSFVGTVEKLGIASGASTQALDAGLLQLGQSLSAGIVRAEEFNSILENIPAVGVAIAEQFGVTVGQLRNLVLQGKVLSSDVFTAILMAQEQANAQFAQMPLTVGRAVAQIRQDFGLVISDLNNATDSTNILAESVLGVSKAFKMVYDSVATVADLIKALIAEAINGIVELGNVGITVYNKATGLLGKAPIAKIDNGFNAGDAVLNAAQKASARQKDLGIYQPEAVNDNKKLGTERKLSTDYADMAAKLGNATTATTKLTAAQKAANQAQQDAKAIFESVQTPAEKYSATLEKLNVLLASGQISQTTFSRAVGLAKDEMDKTNIAMQDLKQGAMDFGKALSGGFYDAITGAKSFKSVLGDLLNNLGRSIFDQGTGKLISGLGSSIFSGLLGAAGGGKGGKGTGITGSISSFVGKLFKFADGGVVDRPTTFGMSGGNTGLMGEAGTEAIMPLKRGSNGKLGVAAHGNSSGGNVINFAPVIDARGADVAAVKRLESAMIEMQRSFEKNVRNASANFYKRDPNFLRG